MIFLKLKSREKVINNKTVDITQTPKLLKEQSY